MPLVAVDSLQKEYRLPRGLREMARNPFGSKLKRALDGLTLQIAEGERVAVIGPNGAGKSTLARILTGVVTPDSGSARINDVAVGPTSPAKAWVGFARPEDPALHARLAVREALRFHAALYGVADRSGGPALLEQLGGGQLLGQRIQTLSGGERARVSLVKAMLHSPRLLILDEVSRVLDPGAAKLVRALLTDYARKGRSVLLVTHDLAEAATCDRVILMESGRVSVEGGWSAVEPRAREVFGI